MPPEHIPRTVESHTAVQARGVRGAGGRGMAWRTVLLLVFLPVMLCSLHVAVLGVCSANRVGRCLCPGTPYCLSPTPMFQDQAVHLGEHGGPGGGPPRNGPHSVLHAVQGLARDLPGGSQPWLSRGHWGRAGPLCVYPRAPAQDQPAEQWGRRLR